MLSRVKKAIILIAVFVVGLFGALFLFNRQQGVYLGESVVVPTITPVPKPKISGVAYAIDGSKEFSMQTTQLEDDVVSYIFLIADDEQEYILFETEDANNMYTVPSNSWSPDARYIFLIRKVSQSPEILVFNASGETFVDGIKYLDVTKLFLEKFSDMHVADATGWDSRGLLHIRSENQDGTKGPSFWFDVDSRGFIQLAAR
ncbi:MAG TPA: hypothetical protein VLF20_04955 [Patescibacteria group bacterium]|nr:hypothetical protein [Patescibacteria group bacterium]